MPPETSRLRATRRSIGRPGAYAVRVVVAVSARPPPPLDGMQPMNGWNAVVRRAVPAYTAVNSTSRPVVTPGPIGAPFSPRKLTSIARSLTLASMPATM